MRLSVSLNTITLIPLDSFKNMKASNELQELGELTNSLDQFLDLQEQ